MDNNYELRTASGGAEMEKLGISLKNCFGYEPLVDMDILELLNLYEEVKGLNSTWRKIHEEHV